MQNSKEIIKEEGLTSVSIIVIEVIFTTMYREKKNTIENSCSFKVKCHNNTKTVQIDHWNGSILDEHFMESTESFNKNEINFLKEANSWLCRYTGEAEQ